MEHREERPPPPEPNFSPTHVVSPIPKKNTASSQTRKQLETECDFECAISASLAWGIARLHMRPSWKSGSLMSSRRRPAVTINRYFGRAGKRPNTSR